jgi:hypothetical protein
VGPQFHFPTFAVCCNLFNPRLFKKVSKNNRFPKITDFKKQQISFKKQLLILKNNRFQRTADFKKQQISKICTAKFLTFLDSGGILDLFYLYCKIHDIFGQWWNFGSILFVLQNS